MRVDYKQNLHFLYWLILASEDLLKEAIRQCQPGRLHDFYVKHLADEKDHARWLKDDLANMGVELSIDFRAAAIAGSQFYLIRYKHPSLLLGYMRVLESWSNDIDYLKQVELKHGPQRTLRYHIEHDPQHSKEIIEEIEAITASHLREQIDANTQWVLTWLEMVFNTMDKEI